jgi:sterol desaturase/sphingolipid hydroxylase (fatty acid hydroxylase superfamily)
MTSLAQSGLTIVAILAGMAAVSFVETVIPLHLGERSSRSHVRVNLALTFIAFATNLLLNTGVVAGLVAEERLGVGLLNTFPQSRPVELLVVLLGLDLAFYVAHAAMHKIPGFWSFHVVHHSDVVVDVTTTIRQHPGESVIRYAFTAAAAAALGASPAAFAVYRTWSVLTALLEHANIRLPPWLDGAVALVATSPNMHKVHHSRTAAETDSNYGNVFSFWDRLFGTFTPAARGTDIAYGLDGLEDRRTQSLTGLLRLPFRRRGQRPGAVESAGSS